MSIRAKDLEEVVRQLTLLDPSSSTFARDCATLREVAIYEMTRDRGGRLMIAARQAALRIRKEHSKEMIRDLACHIKEARSKGYISPTEIAGYLNAKEIKPLNAERWLRGNVIRVERLIRQMKHDEDPI